ncbi:hypothetical protein Hanom_Chr10g00936561 [Helianthus anomalus]
MLTIDCGWKKGCTDVELKNAYKKLSLIINIDLIYLKFDFYLTKPVSPTASPNGNLSPASPS